MTVKLISSIVSTGLSLWLAGEIAALLTGFGFVFTKRQRVGLALWGGGVILSIATIWAGGKLTPYSVWYMWVWRLGCCLFLSGLAVRLRRHRDRNLAAVEQARDYLHSRGLIAPDKAHP